MLELKGIAKRYGETVALADATLRFRAGTVHAVLGENGSGKSTLVKVLSGIVRPDAGEMHLDGRVLTGRHPTDFQDVGIATVFQEVLIAPDRTVEDNVLMGVDGLLRRILPRRARKAAVEAVLAPLSQVAIPSGAIAGRLPLAAQQLVVLARALYRKPRILILDEVTAALDFGDRDAVFRAMRRLAGEGVLVIFITHRMDEVMALSDDVSVLRAGRSVVTLPIAQCDPNALLTLMAPEMSDA